MKFLKYITVTLLLALAACTGSSQDSSRVITRESQKPAVVEKVILTHATLAAVHYTKQSVVLDSVLFCGPEFVEVIATNDSIFEITVGNITNTFYKVDSYQNTHRVTALSVPESLIIIHGVPINKDTKIVALQYGDAILRLTFGEIDCNEL